MRLVVASIVLAGCGRIDFTPAAGDADPAEAIAGLIVRYPMDDDPQLGQVLAIPDSFSAPCAPCPTAMAGHRDGAHLYPGTVRVALPGTESLISAATPFTLSVWIAASATAPDIQMAVSKPRAPDTSVNTLNLVVRPAGNIQYELADSLNVPLFFPPSGTPTPSIRDGWHHVAMSWDGTRHTLDLDGVRYEVAMPSRFSSEPLGIGGDEDFGSFIYGFTGALDELRLYDHALDPAEIAVLAR